MSRSRVDLRSPKSSQFHSASVRFRASMYALSVIFLLYLCSVYVPVGWATYILSIIPLVIIILTAIARVNDLTVDMLSTIWRVRRIGLIMTAVYAIAQLSSPVFAGAVEDWPTWRTVIGCWGFALVWLTTPHLPPWHQYIWNNYTEPPVVHPCRRASDDFDSNP